MKYVDYTYPGQGWNFVMRRYENGDWEIVYNDGRVVKKNFSYDSYIPIWTPITRDEITYVDYVPKIGSWGYGRCLRKYSDGGFSWISKDNIVSAAHPDWFNSFNSCIANGAYVPKISKEEPKMDKFYVKVLTPKISEAIQLAAFAAKYRWPNNDKTLITKRPYLYFDRNNSLILHGDGESSGYTLVSIEDCMKEFEVPKIFIGSHEIKFDNTTKSIQVGCQTVSYDIVKQVYERIIDEHSN